VSRVRRDGERIVVELSPEEADVLSGSARELTAMLAGPDARASDPAVRRLLPDAYRDDPEASAEFARYTRDDLTAAKTAAADEVATAIQTAVAAGGRRASVTLDRAAVTTWLRTLTDLRVTLAERLGIRTDSDAAPRRGVGALYWWLGELQELLVLAADRIDGEGDR